MVLIIGINTKNNRTSLYLPRYFENTPVNLICTIPRWLCLGVPDHTSPWGGRNCLFAIPGGAKYKISIPDVSQDEIGGIPLRLASGIPARPVKAGSISRNFLFLKIATYFFCYKAGITINSMIGLQADNEHEQYGHFGAYRKL